MTTKFKFNRAVRELTKTLTHESTSSNVLFRLPKSARIVGWAVNVKTAFDDSATLNVGTSDDADHYIQTLDVTSAGCVDITPSDTQNPGDEMSDVTDIYGIINESPTQGEADVTVLFSMKQGTPI
jgi:hypothetical protein